MSEHSHPASLLPDVLHECHDCGLVQRVGGMRPDQVAACERCGAVLRRRRANSLTTTLALSSAGLLLWVAAVTSTLVTFRLTGRTSTTILAGIPMAFEDQNMPLLALAVACTVLFAPALRLGLTIGVLGGLSLGLPRPVLVGMARLRAFLAPWAMIDVFMLGLFVAYSRLAALAVAEVGPAVYVLGALMLVSAWADTWLDEHAMWEAIGRAPAGDPVPHRTNGPLIGCQVCGEVNHGHDGDRCERCGSVMHHRKPQSITRTWALMITGALLYIPANILPVLTVIRLGQGHPSTIVGGVVELMQARMWPLAALVFVASIAVPMLKLIGLLYLLVSTGRGSRAHLVGRTRIYRIVDFIGRWSMIDVFMAGILTSLVQMGTLATVLPGLGAVAFCAVVWTTMASVTCFDPRLMWDAAGQPSRAPADPAAVPA